MNTNSEGCSGSCAVYCRPLTTYTSHHECITSPHERLRLNDYDKYVKEFEGNHLNRCNTDCYFVSIVHGIDGKAV